MKQRNSNIEILRIIAMMGVITRHYVGQDIGGVEKYAQFPNMLWFFVTVVSSMAVPLVNVFVIISGYYMINKESFTLKRPVELVLIMMFYGLLNQIIGITIGQESFSVIGLIRSMFPILFGTAWFLKTYLILYLIAPFLNRLLNSLSKKGYQSCIAIQVMIFSVWYSIGFSAPNVDDGYGIINFITLYMIGGYLQLYLEETDWLRNRKSVEGIIGYFLCTGITAVGSVFINPYGYSFITNIIAASCLFLAFIKMEERINKWINQLASNAFDVFFVHGEVIVHLNISHFLGGFVIIPHFLFSLIICYLVGCLFGYIRKFVFYFTVDKGLKSWKWINFQFPV